MHGRLLAEIAQQVQHVDAGIRLGEFVEELGGPVGRTIVHIQRLEPRAAGANRRHSSACSWGSDGRSLKTGRTTDKTGCGSEAIVVDRSCPEDSHQ